MSKRLISILLALAMFAAVSLLASAATQTDRAFRVTEQPIGATYELDATAVPLKATFYYHYDAKRGENVEQEKDYPLWVQWCWNDRDSNVRSERKGMFDQKLIDYNREITCTTTQAPKTDQVGVRYYFAVVGYPAKVDGKLKYIEVASNTARIEVIEPVRVIEAKKIDEHNSPLQDAKFEMIPYNKLYPNTAYETPANVTFHAYSTYDGIARFQINRDNFGIYILKETQPPPGYEGTDKEVIIFVGDGGVYILPPPPAGSRPPSSLTINRKITLPSVGQQPPVAYEREDFVNRKIKTDEEDTEKDKEKDTEKDTGKWDFDVRKVDEDNNPLAGAVIQLVPDASKPGNTATNSYGATSDASGKAAFTAEDGYYILSEKSAPNGYNAADEKYHIMISPNGVYVSDFGSEGMYLYSDRPVTFVNKKIPALNKTDHFAYMQGYPTGLFQPNKNMTRAEAVVMFSRLMTESMDINIDYTTSMYYPANYYPDLDLTKWYANQVCFMRYSSVLGDFSRDGRFRGDDPVTRAEFATLATHFDDLTLVDANVFTDVPSSHWAVKYINSAAAKGWITGYGDGQFLPENLIKRAEVVTLVNRILERTADPDYCEGGHKEQFLPRHFPDISMWANSAIIEASTAHKYEKEAGAERWTEVSP